MPESRSDLLRRGLVVGLALAALGSQDGTLAADAAPPKVAGSPPRIGLALSGGGARGIAHVGVLKVLEEMRIPISCVTGTSMGSIVGGTFAAGTPPARLEELVLAANWDEIFRDQPPRDEISMRRKADDYKTLFAPEFGVKDGGLALPKGVIAGVSIEAFFRVLAEPAMGINDFRTLPIPFEAMATDIETGDSVVLSRGSVAQVMRASMSVPGAIAPVEIDGRLLVDGGIANNLPIDQARTLCADVVIAVNISTPPLKRKDLTSALSVAGQLVNFLGKQTVDQQLKSMGSRDVLIEPDLGDISAASFARSKDAIRIGEEATRAMAAALARYSVPPEQYAAYRATQVANRKMLGTVDEIRFEGLERINPEVLRALVETRPGEPLAEEKVGADLRRIYGRGDFESVDYRIDGVGGPRAMVITPAGEVLGAGLPALRPGSRKRFPGRQRVQPARPVSQDRAQPAGRGVVDRGAGRAGHSPLHRVLPAAARGGHLVRLAVGRGRPGHAAGVQRRRTRSPSTWSAPRARASTSARCSGPWGPCARRAVVQVDAKVETGSSALPSVARAHRRPARGAGDRPGRPRVSSRARATVRLPPPTPRRSRSGPRSTTSASRDRPLRPFLGPAHA